MDHEMVARTTQLIIAPGSDDHILLFFGRGYWHTIPPLQNASVLHLTLLEAVERMSIHDFD